MSKQSSHNPMVLNGTFNPMVSDTPKEKKKKVHGETPTQKFMNKIGAAAMIGIMVVLIIAAISYEVPENPFATVAPVPQPSPSQAPSVLNETLFDDFE